MVQMLMTPASLLFMYLSMHPLAEASFAFAPSVGTDDALTHEILAGIGEVLPLGRDYIEKVLPQIQTMMAPIIISSPTNQYGRLDDHAARYVLYRVFMERHGWVIKSFDATGEDRSHASSFFRFREYVPKKVSDILEGNVRGGGSSAVELSIYAGLLEHLIHEESRRAIEGTYIKKRFQVDHSLRRWQVEQVIDMHMACYISGVDIFTISLAQAVDLQERMNSEYHNWEGTRKFFRSIIDSHVPEDSSSKTAFHEFTFEDVANVTAAVVSNFVYWNNHQCGSYKEKLVGMETKNSGRVRLVDFYTSAIKENGTSTFLESVDYLRDLGALDEANMLDPQVVISNYVEGASNCVSRTNYYSVCCMDECADLYSHLENAIRKPDATPAELLPVVEGLNSASMLECRKLPTMLVRRLQDIAHNNNGLVALHGKEFAEWMHLAYPRECATPKLFGSAHFMTVEQWQDTTKINAQASYDEILTKINHLRLYEQVSSKADESSGFEQSSTDARQSLVNPSKSPDALTWTFLFCIMSMLIVTVRLHRDRDEILFKDSETDSSELAEMMLTQSI